MWDRVALFQVLGWGLVRGPVWECGWVQDPVWVWGWGWHKGQCPHPSRCRLVWVVWGLGVLTHLVWAWVGRCRMRCCTSLRPMLGEQWRVGASLGERWVL